MDTGSIGFTIFIVFTGAAVFATAALYARQPLLMAYILLGMLLGPWVWAGSVIRTWYAKLPSSASCSCCFFWG